MPMMNIGMQRRIGKLPKTAEIESVSRSGYYGYSHAGYKGRKPTPRYEGFFGIGSGYYGNAPEAAKDLPASGFYGANTDDDDEILQAYLNGHYLQLGETTAATEEDMPVNTQNVVSDQIVASEGFVLSNNAMVIGAGLALVYLLSRN